MNLHRTHEADRRLRVACAQINPTIGDIEGNVSLMLDAARDARHDDADVVVFPELSLTGYYPGDLLDEAHFADRIADGLERLKLASRETPDLHWVVGAPVARASSLPGKRFHNGLLVVRNGEVILSYAKQLLPTYNIFDERRHFEPGPDVARVFKVGSHQIGVLICEDGWNNHGQDYAVNPFERLADARPDIVLSINASPSNVGKREQRHHVFAEACRRHKLPMLYVNQVGGHDQLIYDGASFAVDAQGAIVFEAERFKPSVATLVFDPETGRFGDHNGEDLPGVPAKGLPTLEFYRRQIILGLRDYARRCGFKSVVVGSSGGIDSALVIALAAEALGPQNVLAVTMPSVYSSAGSVSDSVTLCQNLGVKLIEHPIAAIVNAMQEAQWLATGNSLKGLAAENLQARIRGTILMGYSNTEGHLLLTTGNKSEVAVGYCTLYGDTNGGLAPIADLYKTEVFALSRHINETAGREMIPEAIINKPPSAELAPGQKDTDSLPPYDLLDDILRLQLEPNHLADEEAEKARRAVENLVLIEGDAMVRRIASMIARNEYKRRQAPPILRVRGRAFGAGRQMPIAAVHIQ